MIKRWIALALMLCLLGISLLPCAAVDGDAPSTIEEETASTMKNLYRYGLHVEADGTLTLEGEPFYGFGLNYFGAFCHYESGLPRESFVEGFASIAAHGIPFVRLPLSGYYPDYYDRFDADPEAMLDQMQEVLDEAEKNSVGVIVSLMWWVAALPEHVGEKRSAMGDPESKTMAYAKNYVATVVERFADHPAVWGWEIGNEYNLDADLCDRNCESFLWQTGLPGFSDSARTGYDYFTSDELVTFFTEIAQVIREYDAYRMITTGHAEMRQAAWSMHKASRRPDSDHFWTINWTHDTRKAFNTAVSFYTPDPIDTVSFHLQFGTSGAAEPSYVFTHERFGETISSLDYFKAYVEAAKVDNKALYFGEFGDFLDMESAEDCPEKFRQVMDWITEAGIQVASLWQFQDFDDSGVAAKKLDVLTEVNAELVADGLQKTAAAWETHEMQEPISDTTTLVETSTETTTSTTGATPPDTSVNEDTEGSSSVSDTSESSDGTGCTSSVVPAAFVSAAAVSVALKKRKKKD